MHAAGVVIATYIIANSTIIETGRAAPNVAAILSTGHKARGSPNAIIAIINGGRRSTREKAAIVARAHPGAASNASTAIVVVSRATKVPGAIGNAGRSSGIAPCALSTIIHRGGTIPIAPAIGGTSRKASASPNALIAIVDVGGSRKCIRAILTAGRIVVSGIGIANTTVVEASRSAPNT